MSTRLIALGTVLALILILCPDRAAAEIPAPWGITRGFSVEGGFGANGVTDDEFAVGIVEDFSYESGDIRTLVGFYLGGYYRIIDYVSVGLSLQYAFLRPVYEAMEHDAAGLFGLLAEVRGHFPVSRFDPFLGLGIGFATAFSSTSGHVEAAGFINGDYDSRISLRGVGVGFSVGANIYVTRQWAVSLFLRIIFGAYTKACYRETYVPATGGDTSMDVCNSLQVVYEENITIAEPEDLPHLWSAGLALTYYFDFPRSVEEDEDYTDDVEIVEDEESYGDEAWDEEGVDEEGEDEEEEEDWDEEETEEEEE